MKRILLVLLACLVPAPARAQTIDLTTLGASFFGVDGVRWYQGSTFPGFVTLLPFLRLQGTSTENGFNTDFRPLPPDAVSTVTHSITPSSFGPRILTDVSGAYRFYSFFVDMTESTTNGDNYLSLDSLTVYSVPQASGGSLSTRSAIASVGTVRYDMDQPANQTVLLDGNLIPGSGLPDVEIDVPTSRFDGVAAEDFIYVVLNFGQVGTVSTRKYGASGGFEEVLVYPVPLTGVGETAAGPARPWVRVLAGPSRACRIRYYVPGPGTVRWTVHDVHGRAVASASSREAAGGIRELSLQSLPNAQRLASGIYFYTFTWNEVRESGKVAILR